MLIEVKLHESKTVFHEIRGFNFFWNPYNQKRYIKIVDKNNMGWCYPLESVRIFGGRKSKEGG